MLKLIGRLIYRIFVTAFFVGLEIAIYMTIEVAYLRPASDVYYLHCGEGGAAGAIDSCGPFSHSVLALTIVQVVVGATLVLGLLGIVLIFARHKKAKRSAPARPESKKDTEEVRANQEPASDRGSEGEIA